MSLSVASSELMNTSRGFSRRIALCCCSASVASPVAAARGATVVLVLQAMLRRARLAPERGHQPAVAGVISAAIVTSAGAITRARTLSFIFRIS
jgi:hypothetical protein